MTAENIPQGIEENRKYEFNDEIKGETEEKRKERIAREIAELEKQNIQNVSKQTLRDYSNSDDLITKKYKRKQRFDNEKFLNLLEDLLNYKN